MAAQNDRRDFLSLFGAGASGLILASAGGDAQAAPEVGRGRVFQGTSKTGDLKEALDAAIQAAAASARGNDRQVRWTLKTISGVNGGIIGAREITVAIEASIV